MGGLQTAPRQSSPFMPSELHMAHSESMTRQSPSETSPVPTERSDSCILLAKHCPATRRRLQNCPSPQPPSLFCELDRGFWSRLLNPCQFSLPELPDQDSSCHSMAIFSNPYADGICGGGAGLPESEETMELGHLIGVTGFTRKGKHWGYHGGTAWPWETQVPSRPRTALPQLPGLQNCRNCPVLAFS